MSAVALAGRQVGYVNKAFWRNPTSAFFTFAFPLMFLVVFTALLGNHTLHIGSMTVKQSTYYVAAMGTFGVISACFNNMAISTAFQRDRGILKRVRGTPLPGSAYLGARVVHAIGIGVLLIVITTIFGRLAYSAHVPSGATLGRFILMLIVGSGAFCALGLALTALIPNADAAPAVVNGVILPLLFLSGIFIPFQNNTPSWILWVARIFPVRHFALGMQAGYLGTPFSWTDVLVVAAWGVGGLLLAVRFFNWEPRR